MLEQGSDRLKFGVLDQGQRYHRPESYLPFTDVFILLENNMMDPLFLYRLFCSETSMKKLALELWKNFIPYTGRKFKRNERELGTRPILDLVARLCV